MRRLSLALALVTAVAVAAPALAAPDFNGSLSAAATTLVWEGTAYGTNIAGEPCDSDHSCEDMLVSVADAGSVAIKWEGSAPAGPAWLAGTVYKSDASGAEGAVVADGGGLEDSGGVTAKLQPGFYLVRISGLLTSLATYKATATLKPTVAPGGAVDSDIAQLAASQSAKKLKAFKGTARGASKVEVGLVKTNGGCSELIASGTFKKIAKTAGKCVAKTFLAATGTATWTFKLKKALAKGSYTLTSRATGASGAETTFDKADKNLASFKVK